MHFSQPLATPPRERPYKERVGGIMVGYTGHVPGARSVEFTAPLGALPPTNTDDRPLGQGEAGRLQRDQAWLPDNLFEHEERPWRFYSNGVMVGYKGHVPREAEIVGMATKGGVPPFAAPGQVLGQTTEGSPTLKQEKEEWLQDLQEEHEDLRAAVTQKQVLKSRERTAKWLQECTPYTTASQAAAITLHSRFAPKPTKPSGAGFTVGYRGHVPKMQDMVGASCWSYQ
ncbi:hypothetical protein AB1Y20_002767 [Prymnesium parvum]|uniref:Uncharacterized protein n=1 Tax=Prymnesium parvum TaxID=97485 RepID=A0AB34JCB9_PRYPA